MSESTLVLTDEELVELTGYQRGCAQARWLKAEGFKYRLDRRNRPRVDRTHYMQKMGATPADAIVRKEPNWAALLPKSTSK